ncbi:MAG: MgtC/SapB family protein [Candidatus Aenigmatarchaeota archaeon]|nr:MAG: MgtC/SapB family protein [Candidatus Aenigmarchaeota archaeon]
MIVQLEIVVKLILAVALGGLIGIEREKSHKPAGIRTHMLVALGACLFTISSMNLGMDSARIAAGIVTGIGFIGAGTIISSGKNIKGITTAASLWTTSAVGLLVGIGEYFISTIATLFILIILLLDFMIKKWLK